MELKKLEIIHYPNPVLNQRCDSVWPERLSEAIKIADRLKEIMLTYDGVRTKWIGVGMSANQIGISKRIFIINPSPPKKNTTFEGRERAVEYYFNPEIISNGKQVNEELEGCLSDQSIFKPKKRYQIVGVEYMNAKGWIVKDRLTGWHAKVFQHEIDHLNGKLCRDD